MHIPDNFLPTPVWATLDAIALPAVFVVSRKAQAVTEENRLPMLGVMGAFVFAAQMINFPLAVGTSGHLVGGALLACLLGPWPAALVLTAILIVQALIFQDGGVLALGANVMNMALAGVLAGYLPVRSLFATRWKNYGVFLGGIFSVLVSGVLALAELLLSGIRMTPALIEVSFGLLTVNGFIEGAITVSVLSAIERLNPGLTLAGLRASPERVPAATWRPALVLIGCVSSALVAGGILFASSLPDGLEHLAKKLGVPFGHALFRSQFADYEIHALGKGWLSRATAGLAGLLLIYAVCTLGGHLLARARRSYS